MCSSHQPEATRRRTSNIKSNSKRHQDWVETFFSEKMKREKRREAPQRFLLKTATGLGRCVFFCSFCWVCDVGGRNKNKYVLSPPYHLLARCFTTSGFCLALMLTNTAKNELQSIRLSHWFVLAGQHPYVKHNNSPLTVNMFCLFQSCVFHLCCVSVASYKENLRWCENFDAKK